MIDGKLNNACWRDAATATDFLDSFNSKKSAPRGR